MIRLLGKERAIATESHFFAIAPGFRSLVDPVRPTSNRADDKSRLRRGEFVRAASNSERTSRLPSRLYIGCVERFLDLTFVIAGFSDAVGFSPGRQDPCTLPCFQSGAPCLRSIGSTKFFRVTRRTRLRLSLQQLVGQGDAVRLWRIVHHNDRSNVLAVRVLWNSGEKAVLPCRA